MKHTRKHYFKRLSYYFKKRDWWAVRKCIRCIIKPIDLEKGVKHN